MRIKSCTDYVKEARIPTLWYDYRDIDADIPQSDKYEFMYHAVEPEDLDSVLRYGLKGDIYLTLTPEEAAEYHPIVLKINVKERKLIAKDEGFVVKDIPKDQIERYDR